MWPLPLHSRKFNTNCPSKPVAYKKRHQNCTKVYMKTESYILLILSFKIAHFSSSCHLQGDLANSLTDEFKKKNNSNYNGFCARRSTTLWTRYNVILVPIRWLTSFCLKDNIKGLACSFKSLHVFSLFVVCVKLRGGTERGIREKIRVGLVERENKQNDHARLIVLCNGKDSPDQKGRKSRALNADNTSFWSTRS